MTELRFRTGGGTSPKDKPKVYFTCHPADYDRFFDKICEDIFKTCDCAIFYTEDMTARLDGETLELDLCSMNLFVIPVTCRLLTEPNRAMDEDCAFAEKNHIPVLPLMAENSIDEFYVRRFGERQYISVYDHDPTKRSYPEQLAGCLRSVLTSKETVERIRKAFDARIFLSYRKTDRRSANELMRMIHAHPGLEKLAIWYDEFLTPGESFRENIRSTISSCCLMLLLVTPRLLEKPNFIMDEEYPAAKSCGKPVLPVLMEPTDPDGLRECYKDIPEPVSVLDETEFDARIIRPLLQYASDEPFGDPERDCLIGLAYLDGIDVEIDKERGVRLITAAAEAELPEAMERLRDMYAEGISVELSYADAVKWAQRLLDHYYYTLGETDEKTLAALDDLALAYAAVGDYKTMMELALRCYQLRIDVLGKKHPDTLKTLNKVAFAFGALGDHQRSLELHHECYRLLCEALGEKHPDTLPSLHHMVLAYRQLGEYQKALTPAIMCFQLSSEVLGVKHPHTLNCLNTLASIYGLIGDYQMELVLTDKAYRLSCEILGENHPDTLTSLLDLALAYSHIGNRRKSLELNLKCYQPLYEILGEKHPKTMSMLNNLAMAYGAVGDYREQVDLLTECYDLRCEVLGEYHPNTLCSLRNLLEAYVSAGDVSSARKICEYVRLHAQITDRRLLSSVYCFYKTTDKDRNKAQEIKRRLDAPDLPAD